MTNHLSRPTLKSGEFIAPQLEHAESTLPKAGDTGTAYNEWRHHRAPVAEKSRARKQAPGLTREAIEAFQDAYREDTGVQLTYSDAAVWANKIMDLMTIITRPMQRDLYLIFLERMQRVAPHLLSDEDREMLREHKLSPYP